MSLSRAILNTLLYHNIFNYPLNIDEIYKYLIEEKVTKIHLDLILNKLKKSKLLRYKNDQYYLPGKATLVKIKKQRYIYSKKKLELAMHYANILKVIPTIKLVAISGALAMNNSNQNDDVDLFIISAKGNVWSTRLASTLILHPYRRKPHSKKTKDKVCLNMFLDSSIMSSVDKNLYIAHEIAQLRPIWDRENSFEKYIKKNIWIKKYFPNWTITSNYEKLQSNAKSFPYFEKYLKNLQLRYMHSKITSERLEDKQIFFHPNNTQEKVLSEYKRNIKNVDKKNLNLRK